eukprot:3122047-Pleurochrysis_carterae.AAC.1
MPARRSQASKRGSALASRKSRKRSPKPLHNLNAIRAHSNVRPISVCAPHRCGRRRGCRAAVPRGWRACGRFRTKERAAA